MRCFVAVEIDDRCRKALTVAVGKLRGRAGNPKWVRPENMHLTLKFTGSLDEKLLPDVCRALNGAGKGIQPFTMKVEGLGSFPPGGNPGILFACVREESGNLMELARCVESELASAVNIKRDKRMFIPHITLFRARRNTHCPSARSLSQMLDNACFGAVEADEFVLMQSELGRSGPTYTVLERFGLNAGSP